jgi:hypothetical protein
MWFWSKAENNSSSKLGSESMKIAFGLLAAIILLSLQVAAQCPCDVEIRTGPPGPLPPGLARTLPSGVAPGPYAEIKVLPAGAAQGEHATLRNLRDLNIAVTDLPEDAVLHSFTVQIYSKRGKQVFQATRRLPKSAQQQRAFTFDAYTARTGSRYFVPGNTIVVTVHVAFTGGHIKVSTGKAQ